MLNRFNLTSRGFWLYSPISILAFPVSVLLENNKVSIFKSILMGVLLTLISYVAYMALVVTTSHVRGPNKFLEIMRFALIPLLTGALRGMVFYYLVSAMKIAQPSDLLPRIISSSFTTFFWLGLANFVINAVVNFRLEYRRALKQALTSKGLSTASEKVSLPFSKELDNLETSLRNSIASYLGDENVNAFQEMSTALSNQINEEIRPLSQRIWVRNLSEYPIVNFQRLLIDSVKYLDFSYLYFFLSIDALSLFSNLVIRSVPESLFRTLTFTFFIFLLIQTKPRNTDTNLARNIIFLIYVSALPIIGSEICALLLGFEGNWYATFIIIPIPAAILVMLSLLKLALKDREFLLGKIRQLDTEGLLNSSDNRIEGAALASYLHNTLQSELLALSKQLEKAAYENNPKHSQELLQRVSSLVNRSLTEDFARTKSSPRDRIAAVINSWKGILTIQADLPDSIFEDGKKASILVHAIEEISSNAFRHDKATEIVFTAKQDGSRVLITAQSNGKEKIARSKGLGSAWLDEVAQSPWTISKNEIGTLLDIEI